MGRGGEIKIRRFEVLGKVCVLSVGSGHNLKRESASPGRSKVVNR